MITNPPITATPENDLRTNADNAFDASTILGSIEFRVIRSGASARRMRINATRCTLGSGEDCTVRLDDPTLRPMHAVILRDATKVLLRAYTVPIEVNGDLTAETLLRVGDHFTLGSYRFELVHSPDLGLNRESGDGLSGRTTASAPLGEALGDSNPVEVELLGAASTASPYSLMSHLLEEGPRESGRRTPLAKRPTRLSFIGGVEYVSEAIQSSFNSIDGPKTTLELTQKSTQRLQADQLRREVAAWRSREQKWKDQEAQTRSELADAVARFHQSQQQAEEASDAVKQMRRRVSQLTEEMESLAKESANYREKAERAKERYRKAVDAASEARDEAIRQRNEAELKIDQSSNLQLELIRERDLLRQERDAAVADRSSIVSATQNTAEERRKVALYKAELAKMSEDFAAQQASLTNQCEELKGILKTNDEQARISTEKLAQAQHRIEMLSDELCKATEKLVAARGEVAAAQVQIEALSIEVSQRQEMLTARNESSEQTKREHEALIEQLRMQVARLEADYAAVCEQASLAGTDSGLVDTLNAQLTEVESRCVSDKLSWEQEAVSLHASINQLSTELELATTQLSQKEVEHEATQTELNSAYERLTSVRRELAARPTTAQWDELQKQLSDTEQQLAETEKQIEVLRREYEHLRSIDVAQNAVGLMDTSATISAVPVPESLPVVDPFKVATAAHTEDQQLGPNEPNSDFGDNGWPTYGATQDGSFDPDQDIGLDGVDANANVADRLSTYTSHEKAQRLWHTPPKSQADDRSSGSIDKVVASVPGQSSEQASNAVNADDVISKEPSIGSLAKQLIAELKTDHSSIQPSDESLSVSQSLGSWVSSPTRWQQSEDQATDDGDAPDRQVKSLESLQDSFSIDSQLGNELWQIQDTPPAWDRSFELSGSDSAIQDKAPIPDIWSTGNELIGGQAFENESEPLQDDSDHTYMLAGTPLSDIVEVDAFKQSDPSEYLRSSQADASGHDSRLSSDSSIRTFDFQSEVVESDQVSPPKSYSVIEPVVQVTKDEPATDDDSIEAYMNRLLQRVQGQSSPPPEKSPQPSANTSSYSQPTFSTKAVHRESVPSAVPETPAKPSEVIDPNTPIVPRSQAPEDAGHLAAMRELANATANSAISQSVRGQAEKMKSKAIVDLFQAGVVLGCAFAFYTCGEKIPSLRYVWFTAAALAVALSIFFVLDMLKKLSAAKLTYDDMSEKTDDTDISHGSPSSHVRH